MSAHAQSLEGAARATAAAEAPDGAAGVVAAAAMVTATAGDGAPIPERLHAVAPQAGAAANDYPVITGRARLAVAALAVLAGVTLGLSGMLLMWLAGRTLG